MPKPVAPVSSLEFIPIREAFPNEPRHFTKWLEEHIEELGRRLGMELTVERREVKVGDFSLDLLCEDKNGRLVIIENQLEKTNHDHLGKLLTYMVNLGAATAIWVTTEPRVEHQKVIDWLNESTPEDISFYLVKIEGVRIEGSPPAPLFTVQAKPDRQSKQVGEGKKELAERHVLRREFWTGLLERTKGRTRLFASISPSVENWISTGAGKSGVAFHYWVLRNAAGVELTIDFDTDTGTKNKVIFDALFAQKDAVEKEYGGRLEWERKDDTRFSRIGATIADHGLTHKDEWPAIQDKMIDAMIRLDKVLRHRLAEIKV